MANFAIVDAGGVIVNRIILDDAAAWAAPDGCTLVQEDQMAMDIGGTFASGVYTPRPVPPPPPPKPSSISDRQFFQQLAVQGVITQDEALAAVRTGAIPAALQHLIDGLPSDQQFGATMILSGATTFERNHPLTIAIGAAYGWQAEQVDALFRAAAVL